MSEINVLKGRKFEDYVKHQEGVRYEDSREVVLERLQQLQLPTNPNNILLLAIETIDFGNHQSFIERVDLITRTLFNQSLFESTQADIEAEAALRDAENEVSRAWSVYQGAYAKAAELQKQYQEKVEDVTA